MDSLNGSFFNPLKLNTRADCALKICNPGIDFYKSYQHVDSIYIIITLLKPKTLNRNFSFTLHLQGHANQTLPYTSMKSNLNTTTELLAFGH